jgi:isoaspartyl peptidase/L-asparaginase-like protein (Ntn-hydrolase superfamily)
MRHRSVSNPVSVARRVMEKTHHVLLVGEGADKFAREQSFPFVATEDLITPSARAVLKEMGTYGKTVTDQFTSGVDQSLEPTAAAAAATAASALDSHGAQLCILTCCCCYSFFASHCSVAVLHHCCLLLKYYDESYDIRWCRQRYCLPWVSDTVGCVCMDLHGNIAAATSTGGIAAKRVGRVGDSPLIGSGGYADSTIGGASTTGHGESIMKVNLARLALFLHEHGIVPTIQQAAERALQIMKEKTQGNAVPLLSRLIHLAIQISDCLQFFIGAFELVGIALSLSLSFFLSFSAHTHTRTHTHKHNHKNNFDKSWKYWSGEGINSGA